MDNRNIKRKAFFEKDKQQRGSYQLTAADMTYLAAAYNNKYKIKLVVNGATESGKTVIKEKVIRSIDDTDWFCHDLKIQSIITSIMKFDEEEKREEKLDIDEIGNELKKLHSIYLKLAEDGNILFKSYPKVINELIELQKQPDKKDLNLDDYVNIIKMFKNLNDAYNNILKSEEKLRRLKNVIADIGLKTDASDLEKQLNAINLSNFQSHHNEVEHIITSIIEFNEEKLDIDEIGNELKKLHSIYLELAKDCNIFFKPYLKKINELIKELNQTDNENLPLHDYVDKIKIFKDINDAYKSILTSKEKSLLLKSQATKFEERMYRDDDTALTKAEAVNEINEIRNSLKDDEAIGYVFTNNHRILRGHFEVIIITRDLIIKPCEWGVLDHQAITNKDIENLSSLEMLSHFVRHENYACLLPSVQAGKVECGTLGMLYLKELLKNNADQLRNFTIHIPFYDKKEKLRYFCIPSPHVLRYSQSGTFNKIFLGMLSEQLDPVKIPFEQRGNKDTLTVQTIAAILKNTMDKAGEKGDKKVIESCQILLKELPTFRAKWLENYHLVMPKRADMQTDQNEYLAYSTQRLLDKR